MTGRPAIPAAPPRVALLVETSLSSGRDILLGISRYVREHRPWAVWIQPHDLNRPPPAWFRQWRGDGIIVRGQNRRVVDIVTRKRVPAVDVLGVVEPLRLPLVHVDNRRIAGLAAEHLLGCGLRHFAYFGLTGESWSDERRAAFVAFLRERGLDAATLGLTRRRLEQRPWDTVVREIARWVSALPLPCGVMLCSDERGLVFQEACRRADRAIGEQIAVVGVGNDRPMCDLLRPALSSVEADHERVGYEAAALLDRLMRGEKPSSLSARIAPLRVVVRASSDVLAVPDAVVNRAVSFIRQRACGGIGVEDVARHAAVSRSVLQRRFRALLRHTVHDEIVHARLRRSIELLGQTDLPVEEVAEQTGFGYAKNLRQALRDRFGRAPGDYRRRPASNTPPPDSRGAERKGPVAP